MLKHHYSEPVSPPRVVVLGARGFVAAATIGRLASRGVPVLGLPRTVLDLTQLGAGEKLARILRPDDALLFVAAKAPVKSEEMLIENLRMGAAVSEAIRQTALKHVVYVSSDAVYADSDAPLTEHSCAQPTSLHGVMHLAREVMLCNVAGEVPLCIVRPTLIFGKNDPHNGYGPNRFLRQAGAGEVIELFGEGEERRDHVWVEDVAEIVRLCLDHRTEGILNIATGQICSFREIAEKAISLFDRDNRVVTTRRVGPVPHNGFRAFNTESISSTFPHFRFRGLLDYMSDYCG